MLKWLDRLLEGATRWLAGTGLASTPPALDLHGMGVSEAIRQTEAFLSQAQAQGVNRVRIIYGKGRHSPGSRGVLRQVIPRWLASEGKEWVESFSPTLEPSGEEGSVEVRVKPPRQAR